MIEKVVTKCSLQDWSKIKDDLSYWLSKTPQQRIETVEYLRSQYYGNPAGLQRTARVVKRQQKALGRKKDLADIEALGED